MSKLISQVLLHTDHPEHSNQIVAFDMVTIIVLILAFIIFGGLGYLFYFRNTETGDSTG